MDSVFFKAISPFVFCFVLTVSCVGKTSVNNINLVVNGSSAYKIIIPQEALPAEQKAAQILQKYLRQISGFTLPVLNEGKDAPPPAIYVGQTKMANKLHPLKLPHDAYFLKSYEENIIIAGGKGRGLFYGVYSLLENYMDAKKLEGGTPLLPTLKSITLPGNIFEEKKPQFLYRQVYYPACNDYEYLDWHKLQRFEDLWGLWGHSYNKLVPAQTYFKTHPEYYALVNGNRQPSQLCLSNEDVYNKVVEEFKKRMNANPDGYYWSISPNDDKGYCTCEKCSSVDNAEGGPQGSLIKFVNRVAANFPDKIFTTLAYGYTHRCPKNTKPADNVYILLSSIDAFRDKPLAVEGTASAFRHDLKEWSAVTSNIFVWDYVTEFTNYLAPFPNFQSLKDNITYMKNNGVKGIFEQGSGDTYSEWAELRCYLLGKLLWDDNIDVEQTTTSFMEDYYGKKAAQFLIKYNSLLTQKMMESKRKLDIYGNPINEWNSYLTPDLIDQYTALFDQAEAAVENNPLFSERIMRARLPLEYTVLQQARLYGIEKHGIFVNDDNDKWIVKPKFKEKIALFISNCKKAGVTEMSEGGPDPEKYKLEWEEIIANGVTPTLAVGANVTLKFPFVGDYGTRGNNTLTDGNSGYLDFSYNWLCFYGKPMIATIDLGKPTPVYNIKVHFLDDPRHWIFLPEKIIFEMSNDGETFTAANEISLPAEEEHYDRKIGEYILNNKNNKMKKCRFIRVTSLNLEKLPPWRERENKLPMIACDEVYVK